MPRRVLLLMTLVACAGPPSEPDPELPDAGPGPTPDASPPMVEELPPLGDGVGTLSGASVPGRVDGARGIARFSNPVNVVSDGAGGVVVCDFDNSTLRRVSADGTASSPFTVPTGFARPFGAVRTGDTLYVETDRSTTGTATGALWRVSLSTNNVTLVRDNFGRYRGLGVLSDGRLVGAEYLQHVISIIDPSTGVATVLAGTAGQYGMVNDVGAAARFNTPYDLVVLPSDDIVIADYNNHVIRKVSLDGNVVTLADTAFTTPQGLALASDGTIYVSDPGAAKVFAIAPTDHAVSTAAGTGTPGYLDDADPLAAQLFGLEGVDVDAGYLYVADGSGGEDLPYHRVRRIKR
jgi:sugar lactone lactonase YvrE